METVVTCQKVIKTQTDPPNVAVEFGASDGDITITKFKLNSTGDNLDEYLGQEGKKFKVTIESE